jgi:phosphoglycolate phosphatase
MEQKLTVLFDLDGTLVDTAPDLIRAHNHVMKKFGYPTKSINELKNAVGKGAKAIMAKGNGKWEWFDEKIKNEMTDEFLSFYKKNILHESTLLNGVKEFLKWCKNQNISMAVCTNKTEHLAIDLLKKIEFMTFLNMFRDIILLNIVNQILDIYLGLLKC